MRVAFLGGSFDPPHAGHIAICEYLLQDPSFNEVMIIPVWEHAFDKPLTPFEHRWNMCQLAFDSFGSRVKISDIEKKLGGKSFTLQTLRALKKEFPTAEWVIALGEDAAQDLPKWHDYEALKQEADCQIFPRGKKSPIPDISSSELRKILQKKEMTSSLIPKAVMEYIREHHLY